MNLIEEARKLRTLAYQNDAFAHAYMLARHAAWLAHGVDVAVA